MDIAVHHDASIVVVVPHLAARSERYEAGISKWRISSCVNKVDLPGAELAKRDLGELVMLGGRAASWSPPIVGTSTVEVAGIDELGTRLIAHEKFLDV